jgi:hypothetical protein
MPASTQTSPLVVTAALVATLSFQLSHSGQAHACAVAPAAGQAVHTQREDALIVWDESRHLEHFVRSAVFETTAKSFGFLVPTPSRPTLAEASETAVTLLAGLTAAAVVHESTYVLVPIGCTMLPFELTSRKGVATAAGVEAPGGVHVLEQTRVAGLDAVVLEADDAGALAAWLHAHDFAFRDALQRWVGPYLAKHWKITAFRYSRPELASNAPMAVDPIASRAVRMTFPTDTPVYPYREPDDVPVIDGRELRLFVLSSSPLEGRLADEADRAWPAALPFSARLASPLDLGTALPDVALPSAPWLMEFSDGATRREPSDLALYPAPSREEIRRPPVVVPDVHALPLPYELPFVVGGIAWWRRRARRRRSATGSSESR